MASDAERHLLAFFTTMENQGGIIVKDAPKLDLELYIANYKGRTRFDRLILIGQSSVPLCVDALKAAIVEAKAGKDVQRYRDAWERIHMAAPDEPEAQFDDAWVSTTTRANKLLTHQLETELRGYKSNLVKESIRIGHRDLGEHLESIGNLSGATEVYVKMRPESSTVSHIVDVGKHIIGVMLQRRDWTGILANINKIMPHNLTTEEITVEQPYQKMVAGLAHLGSGKYAEAANNFLDVGDYIICVRYNDIASVNDIAVYGGLLALASMERDELQKRVLDNSSFRSYLELEPQIRRAVSMFVNCRYSACLEILEQFRSDYLLDLYLQKHVATIFSLIRKKCIIQYLFPFSCVTLAKMNTVFAKPDEDLEAELVSMIKSGALKARMDTIEKLLVMIETEPRVAMQNKALKSANLFCQEASEWIRRMSLVAADLEVKGASQRKGANSAGGLPGLESIFADDLISEFAPEFTS